MWSKDFMIANRKKISLFILFVGVVFSLGIASRSITGFTTDIGQSQQSFQVAQNNTNFIMQEREDCLNNLNTAQNSYSQCQSSFNNANSNLNFCNSEKQNLQDSYNTCLNNSQDLQNQLAEANNSYNELAKNYVFDKCCSIADYKAGTTKNWSIENNFISCNDNGNNTINCFTGNVTM